MNTLTSNSLKIINDINNKKNDIIKLSNNNFFNKLKSNFIKIYKKYDNNIKNIEINKIKNELNENSYFVGESIRKKIKKLKNGYLVKINNIEISFFSNKSLSIVRKILLKKIKIVSSLKKLFNRENATQQITIYDINEKKKLPNKNNLTIGPCHCNSGYCNVIPSENKNGSIVLYRNEELIKVLIHESIHGNFIDYSIITNQYKSNMDKKICTNYNILLNESFTETLACLINIILVNYYTKINIDTIFKNEVKHMINIFVKIINHYDINKMDDIIVKNGCKKYFKQSTNVFSYYILKTLNYIYINHFLKIMKKNCNNYYAINNNSFNEEYINFVFNKINNLDKYIYKRKIKNKSLRLSLYELKI